MSIRLSEEEIEQEISKLPGKGYGIAVFRDNVPTECKPREEILAEGVAKAQLKKHSKFLLKGDDLLTTHGRSVIIGLTKELGD